jgi:hypothetical protein
MMKEFLEDLSRLTLYHTLSKTALSDIFSEKTWHAGLII